MQITHDSLQNFIFEQRPIRGQVVRLKNSYQQIMDQHQYPELIRQLLGEALVCVVMLVGIAKLKGKLNLDYHGDGDLKLLSVRCTGDYEIRGFARWDHEIHLLNHIEQSLPQGKLVITFDPEGTGKQRYQSIIAVESTSLTRALEQHFLQSEQLPTRLYFAKDTDHLIGLMLQTMPNESELEDEDSWSYACQLADTLTSEEMLSLETTTLLHRLYHQDDIRLFEPQLIQFGCQCSIHKMANAIVGIGKPEALAILHERDTIEVTCEFCNSNYQFDRIDVEQLFTDGTLQFGPKNIH